MMLLMLRQHSCGEVSDDEEGVQEQTGDDALRHGTHSGGGDLFQSQWLSQPMVRGDHGNNKTEPESLEGEEHKVHGLE